MNLAEALVATTVVLGACSGAAQMGAASASALTAGRARAGALEQIEIQFLAVAPVLRSGDSPELVSCAEAAAWMRQHLVQGLPPLQPGLQRQISLTPSGDQVQVTLQAGAGIERRRLLSPAAYGLCGPTPVEDRAAEAGDAEISHEEISHEETSDAEISDVEISDAAL